MVLQGGKTNPGVHVFAIEDRATYIGAGGLDGMPVHPVKTEHFEAGLHPVGAHEYRIRGIPGIQRHAMSLLEIFLPETISTEFPDEFTFRAELQDELRSISVSHVDISIGTNAGFGGLIFIAGAIGPDRSGIGQGHDNASR